MDRNSKDQIAKHICFAAGTLFSIYILIRLLPYLVMFLALCGAWHLLQEYERKNRRNRH